MTRRDVLKTAPGLAVILGAAQQDPFLGDWVGEGRGTNRPMPVCAQVFPLGQSKYRLNFLPEFDQRCPPYAVLDGTLQDGRIIFSGEGWNGSITPDRMQGETTWRGAKAVCELTKTVRLSPHLGARPPAKAVLLFGDGTGVQQWQGFNARGETGDPLWKSIAGVLHPVRVERTPAAMRHIVTKGAWPGYRLHVEFRSPLMPEARGQARGNSGIVFEDYSYHELQILDSYGLPSYYDDCGAIYKVAAPMVNMCAPPLQWQSYDLDYTAPRYGKTGKVEQPARITVDNGKLIHKQLELPVTEAGEKLRRENPTARRVGRIRLTYHNDAVEYSNIWLLRA
jgi:hypothetical protein